jgi:hypothetical protein
LIKVQETCARGGVVDAPRLVLLVRLFLFSSNAHRTQHSDTCRPVV